jgi:membrane peptidoglycan carboxypeptidase
MLKATYGYNQFPDKSKSRRDLVAQSMVNNDLLKKRQLELLPLQMDYTN